MNAVIYEPLEEYENKLRALHLENTKTFLQQLVAQSGVNVEENRKTVSEYENLSQSLKKLRKKLGWRRFWRVLMCISLILIPLVITKMTPLIRQLRKEIEEGDAKAAELLAKAQRQMEPLNRLFTDWDSINLIQTTVPHMSFYPYFSARQEEDMKVNYDFQSWNDAESTALDVLAGEYNENPFLFENRRVHTMGTETYYGYKTITWTETYRDSQGKLQRRTRSETLQASVTKPKPYYNTQVVLHYCAQGGADLSFTRDATQLHKKSDKAIERYVKKGERRLQRLSDQAVRENDDFTSMSNTEFEVLFDALDRSDEVQFRTLFTPLAQTNMVELLLSDIGYGDDFDFVKAKRTNTILSKHSQGRAIKLLAGEYPSYSYDVIEKNFVEKNAEFFKAVYFDFAPLLSIPAYQERPVHSLKPIPDRSRISSQKEGEALANLVPSKYTVHPNTKTQAILKCCFVGSQNNADEVSVTAYSYDIEDRVDVVSVHGGDGRWHNVNVPWQEYLPLEVENRFYITEQIKDSQPLLAKRNNLRIYK